MLDKPGLNYSMCSCISTEYFFFFLKKNQNEIKKPVCSALLLRASRARWNNYVSKSREMLTGSVRVSGLAGQELWVLPKEGG